MSYSPTLGQWVEQDPEPYEPNLYQFLESSPPNLTDPMGLAPTSQPVIDPIKFGTGVSVWSEEFELDYMSGPHWGKTDIDPNGRIFTELHRLVLPQPLPDCLKAKQAEVQMAIDAFNYAALVHEKDSQDWFQEHYSDWLHDRNRWNKDHGDKFGPNATWELMELHSMYSYLRDALKSCECPEGNVDNNIARIDQKLKDFLDKLNKRSVVPQMQHAP